MSRKDREVPLTSSHPALHTLVLGSLRTNCYILQSGHECIVVDPGDEPERIVRFLKDAKTVPKLIVSTHAHFDHVLGVPGVRMETHAKFALHKDDLALLESFQPTVLRVLGHDATSSKPPIPDMFLEEGDLLSFGIDAVRVLHTPGHSPGSISLVGNGFVLTGDALFNQSIGRTDLPGGDYDTLIKSIRQKLFRLKDETIVHPGHGPESTIGDEKLANPFVGLNSASTE